MPSLQEALNADTSGYEPVETAAAPTVTSPPSSDLQPTYPTMMRCPLPPIFTAEPDSLRQFYLGNTVPQTRLLTSTNTRSSGGSTGSGSVSNVFVTNSGGGTSVQQQAVFKTAVISPGQSYTGVINMAKSYQLLSTASTVAARVELYGSSSAQTQDLSRPLDYSPAAGTVQGIVCDVALDTAPFSWSFQNRVGANSDNPQVPESYITITNLSMAAVAVTVTIQYVSLES